MPGTSRCGPPAPAGATTPAPVALTSQQIATYLRDGVLVVDDVLSRDAVAEAQRGLAKTLRHDYGVDVRDLEGTGHALVDASSTNGAGGVLDIFYPAWKMNIATDDTLFRMTRQLWKEAYRHTTAAEHGDEDAGADGRTDESFKGHPFGDFDCDKGYVYIDRICYRIPTPLAERLGQRRAGTDAAHPPDAKEATSKKQQRKKARQAIQRSLTPHFDCCPEKQREAAGKTKWRPVQCFVSLTDNLGPNTGGFEAAPGFHREFQAWVDNGRRVSGGRTEEEAAPRAHAPRPQPCVGEYTHLSPSHDRDVMQRVRHVPVRAGSAVFWDTRIPHANAYRNDPPPASPPASPDVGGAGDAAAAAAAAAAGARAVVYCSFLPDVAVNRRFVRRQRADWQRGRAPRVGDRWSEREEAERKDGRPAVEEEDAATRWRPTALGERLLGLVDWE